MPDRPDSVPPPAGLDALVAALGDADIVKREAAAQSLTECSTRHLTPHAGRIVGNLLKAPETRPPSGAGVVMLLGSAAWGPLTGHLRNATTEEEVRLLLGHLRWINGDLSQDQRALTGEAAVTALRHFLRPTPYAVRADHERVEMSVVVHHRPRFAPAFEDDEYVVTVALDATVADALNRVVRVQGVIGERRTPEVIQTVMGIQRRYDSTPPATLHYYDLEGFARKQVEREDALKRLGEMDEGRLGRVRALKVASPNRPAGEGEILKAAEAQLREGLLQLKRQHAP